MAQLENYLKEIKKCVSTLYIEREKIQKEIKNLEKERNTLIRKRTDRVYDNYEIDRVIRIINIKIDTLKEILGGGKNVI